jgi:hypothetical protein
LALASVVHGQAAAPSAAVSPPAAVTAAPPAAKTLIDYFQPMPILGGNLSNNAWGAPGVLPRDPQNGLEDPTIKQYNYWDGKIIKGPDGKYHLFASRWDAVKGHNGGWGGSVAVQAVSDNLYGPYVEKGLLWPDNQAGKGHNVTALVMPDGTYAVVVSETRPGDVFVSKSLDGPWTQLGTIQVANQPRWRASNYSMIVRPDGDFEIVPRSGQILISKAKDGILGPYTVMGPSVYPKTDADGTPLRNLEDPVVWYSGGLYHITVNNWSTRKAYHLISKDGITNWQLQGLAYDPTKDFVRYTDGTVNHWNNMERPGVYIENGHVKAFTFAVIDVPKNADRTNDGHGSKVIVIPFDGESLDKDLANVTITPTPATVAPPPAAPAPTTFTPPSPLPTFYSWAPTPPMGWNSWDSFGAGVWQDDVMANADYMVKNLLPHGWNLITIDIQWYEPLAHSDQYRSGAVLVTDANGRLLPAPNRFPLTKDTASFKPVADALHAKGLKFGLHLLRGIPRQSVDRDNAPILGTTYHAQDIADKVNVCRWNSDMYGVDMSKPGAQEYYDSVFALMASWGLDFVKVDDLSGNDAEIAAIRKAIDKCGRPIVFSISPGGPSNSIVASNANQWRISGDFWDNWPSLYRQFNLTNIGTPFRGPGHWPDADMIPFGNIRTWNEKDHWTHFTKDEHYTLMTLWAIAKSPLILGGNLPNNDDFELSLLTNDEIIAVNQHSTNNRQLFNHNNQIVWIANVPDSPDKYVAIFNASPAPPPRGRRGRAGPPPAPPATPATGAPTAAAIVATPSPTPATSSAPTPATSPAMVSMASTSTPAAAAQPAPAPPAAPPPATITIALADIGFSGPVKVLNLWTHQDLGTVTGNISATVNSHGAMLYRVTPAS